MLLAETYQWGEYHRAASTASCYFFVPKSCTGSNLGTCSGRYQSILPSLTSFTCSLATRSETIDALKHAINQYALLGETSLAQFSPVLSVAAPSPSCDLSYLQSANLVPALDITLRQGGTIRLLLPLNDSTSLEATLTPEVLSRALSAELLLPAYDTLALDQYNGVYLWEFRLKLLFSAQMAFKVTASQRIAHVCSARALPDRPTTSKGASTSFQSLATNSTAVSLSYATFVLRVLGVLLCAGYFVLLVADSRSDWRLIQLARQALAAPPPPPSPAESNHKEQGERAFLHAEGQDQSQRGTGTGARKGNGEGEGAPTSPPYSAPEGLYGALAEGEQGVAAFDDLPLRVRARLIDGWRVLSAVASLVATVPLLMSLSEQYGFLLSATKSRLLGASVWLLYVTLLGFLRYSTRLSTAALVLWASFFKVFRVLLSALPVAVGILLAGITSFGEIDENLSSFSEAFFTFFSVINGDILWQSIDIADNTTGLNVLGCLFVVGLYVLFAYVVVRVALAIVEGIYYYMRIYTGAKLKRRAFRYSILAGAGPSRARAAAKAVDIRKHTSEILFSDLVDMAAASNNG